MNLYDLHTNPDQLIQTVKDKSHAEVFDAILAAKTWAASWHFDPMEQFWDYDYDQILEAAAEKIPNLWYVLKDDFWKIGTRDYWQVRQLTWFSGFIMKERWHDAEEFFKMIPVEKYTADVRDALAWYDELWGVNFSKEDN